LAPSAASPRTASSRLALAKQAVPLQPLAAQKAHAVADLATLLILVSLAASRQAVLGPEADVADPAPPMIAVATLAGEARPSATRCDVLIARRIDVPQPAARR
jgi:hypothetical protein